MSLPTKARFLMCAPRSFRGRLQDQSVDGPEQLGHAATGRWRRLRAASGRRFTVRCSDLGAEIDLVPPVPGVPDLVFTANAAVVLDRVALLARFRYPERQREEEHFEAAFRSLQGRGLIDAVRMLPADLVLEGAGDCVWDETRNLFWIGFGPRSDAASQACRRGRIRRARDRARTGRPALLSYGHGACARCRAARSCSCPAHSRRRAEPSFVIGWQRRNASKSAPRMHVSSPPMRSVSGIRW